MNVVLDASAMIAFLRDERGAEVVLNQLSDPECMASAHAPNLCEVYYDFARASSEDVAVDAVNDLLTLGITERNDMHGGFGVKWVDLKARQTGFSSGLRGSLT